MVLISAKWEGSWADSRALAHVLPSRPAATDSSSSWRRLRKWMGVCCTATILSRAAGGTARHFRKRQAKCSSLSWRVARRSRRPFSFGPRRRRSRSQKASHASAWSSPSKMRPQNRVLPQAPCSTDSRAKASAAQAARWWCRASPRLAWHRGSPAARSTTARNASGSSNTSRQTKRSRSGGGPAQRRYGGLPAGSPRNEFRPTSRSR